MSLLQSKFVWENTLTDEQRLEIALEVAAGLLDDRHVKEDDAEHVKRVITLMIDKFTPRKSQGSQPRASERRIKLTLMQLR